MQLEKLVCFKILTMREHTVYTARAHVLAGSLAGLLAHTHTHTHTHPPTHTLTQGGGTNLLHWLLHV